METLRPALDFSSKRGFSGCRSSRSVSVFRRPHRPTSSPALREILECLQPGAAGLVRRLIQTIPIGQFATGDEGREEGRGFGGASSPATSDSAMAYVGDWGWIEGDLIYYFRLREDELGLNLRGFLNGRLGSAFRVTKHVKLGLSVPLPTSVRSTSSRASLSPRATSISSESTSAFSIPPKRSIPIVRRQGKKTALESRLRLAFATPTAAANTLGLAGSR